MKSYKLLLCLSAGAILALSSCGESSSSSSSASSQQPVSSAQASSSAPSSSEEMPSSQQTNSEEPSSSSAAHSSSSGTFINHGSTLTDALQKDYSNFTIDSYQEYEDGAEEDYIYCYDGIYIVYSVDADSYLYYTDIDGVSYLHFDAEPEGTNKEAWLHLGYHDADLSMGNAYFYLPDLLNNIAQADTTYVAGTYVVTTDEKISELCRTAFRYAWYNDPEYIGITVDSTTGYISSIKGIDDVDDDDSPYFLLTFSDIGTTEVPENAELPDAPNEETLISYSEYKGTEPYVPTFPASCAISLTGATPEEGYDDVLDIEEYHAISYSILPENYNQYEELEWHSTDESVAKVGYPYKDSYQRSLIGVGAGECEIYASVQGENGRIESNRIKVKVNPLASQNKEGCVYDFTFVGMDEGTLMATNGADGSKPFSATAQRATVQDGANSTSLYQEGENVLMLNAGVAADSSEYGITPSATFDFDDQQVSSISFYYGFYYLNDRENIDYITEATIETSNDGETWTSIDVKDEILDNISGENRKLMEKSFAPASKVRISWSSNFIGRACRLSLDHLAFMADGSCHYHGAEVIPTTGINLALSAASAYVGATAKATALVQPSNATNQSVTYVSSNPEVASIDESGTITALSVGTTEITATQGEISSSAKTFEVKAAPTLPESLAGKYLPSSSYDFPGYFEIDAANLKQIKVHLDSPEKDYVLPIVSSEDREYTFADALGNKFGFMLSGGEPLVLKQYVSLDGYTPSLNQIEFEKYVAASSVSVTADRTTLYLGSSNATLTKTAVKAAVSPSNATYDELTWTMDVEGIVTLDDDEGSYITATSVGVGTVVLTASTSEGVVGTISLEVKNPIYSSSLSLVDKDGAAVASATLKSNETLTLSAVLDEGATETNVTWSSTDASVASVSKGIVTAHKAGTTTITAKCGSLEASLTITVTGESACLYAGEWTFTHDDGILFSFTIADDGQSATLSCVDFSIDFVIDSDSSTSSDIYFVGKLDDSYALDISCSGSWSSSTSSATLYVSNDFWEHEYVDGDGQGAEIYFMGSYDVTRA